MAQGEQDSSGWKGHSFRNTSTTTMVRLGIEHGIIQRLGRWISAKSMNSYIRKEGDGLPPLDIGWGHLELQRTPQQAILEAAAMVYGGAENIFLSKITALSCLSIPPTTNSLWKIW